MSEKREAILEAALELVSERGFHDAPMSLIGALANVGAGTIYRNFENKEALIKELFLEVKRRMSAPMLEGFSEGRTTEEVFKRIWRRMFQYCLNNADEMRFLEQFYNSPYLTIDAERATQREIRPIIDRFEHAIRAGELKAMAFEMLSIFLYNTVAAHAKMHFNGILIMDEDKLFMAIQACWDAVKA